MWIGSTIMMDLKKWFVSSGHCLQLIRNKREFSSVEIQNKRKFSSVITSMNRKKGFYFVEKENIFTPEDHPFAQNSKYYSPEEISRGNDIIIVYYNLLK